MKKINALFVETNGVYFNQENIDPWDIERNAFNCKNGALEISQVVFKKFFEKALTQ